MARWKILSSIIIQPESVVRSLPGPPKKRKKGPIIRSLEVNMGVY